MRIDGNNSFGLYDDGNVRTLSTNTVSNGADIHGLLYVPDLDPADPCINASQPHIPSNATRKRNFPDQQYVEYPFIAFAPWISASCTKSYLAAASGVRAFMTYLPDNGVMTPPLANNKIWDLQDGGQWKAQNKFPVYAIPGAEGATIMQQMGQYSGNSSNAKIADMLTAQQLDPSDYVRLYASFGTKEPSNLPTLWAFLLIVLGLVFFIVGATSFLMHWVQRRRRRDLQRRVENGEVNLEILGVTRARISQEAIDSLPKSVYTLHEDISNREANHLSEVSAQAVTNYSTPGHSQWSQPTCPICLDDFIPNTTTIRSLPCHHIYHPECIDPFLRDNSSLCPVCKAAVLTPDSKYYISEPITNYMVRQERWARHTRQARGTDRLETASAPGGEGENGRRIANSRHGMGRRVVSGPGADNAAPTANQIEMEVMERRAISGQAATRSSAAEEVPRPETPLTDASLRRAWFRRRFSTLSGQGRTLSDEETERLARRPRCEYFIC